MAPAHAAGLFISIHRAADRPPKGLIQLVSTMPRGSLTGGMSSSARKWVSHGGDTFVNNQIGSVVVASLDRQYHSRA